MKTENKMELVAKETLALMEYIDKRGIKADIGISALVSALAMSVLAVGLPMEVITDSLLETHQHHARSMSSEGQVVH